MYRKLLVALALVVPALAAAQDGGSGGGDNSMLLFAIGAVAVLGIVVTLLLLKKKDAAPAPLAQPKKAAVAEADDEHTQVRISGHRLVRIHGGVKVGAEFPIVGVITVGRGANCSITLNDSEMSTKHADFTADRRGAYVTDNASTNGTFVNEQRISPDMPTDLKDGDIIRMGGTTLLYKSGA